LKPENKAQLQAILKYHVLPVEVFSKDLTEGLTAATVDGPSVTVTSVTPPTINDASEIINPLDVAASNGVVHTIDAVLTPPTLYAYLGTLGDYSTLLAAIDAADLKDTLNGAGTFTLFAPTDAAFAALPDGTVEDLLKPENKDQLVAILTYHVLGTEVTSADLTLNLKATTVNGAEIEITSLDPPTINDASEIVPPSRRRRVQRVPPHDRRRLDPALGHDARTVDGVGDAPTVDSACARLRLDLRDRQGHAGLLHTHGRHRGRGPRGDALRPGHVHGFRPEQRGLRRAPRRHGRRPLEAREQSAAPGDPQVPRPAGRGLLEGPYRGPHRRDSRWPLGHGHVGHAAHDK